MHFLTGAAVDLKRNLMAFIDNLRHMRIGMVLIFAVMGIVNFLFSE